MQWNKLIGISKIINGLNDIKKPKQTNQQNQTTNKLTWPVIKKHGTLDIHRTKSIVWKALVEVEVELMEVWESVANHKGWPAKS